MLPLSAGPLIAASLLLLQAPAAAPPGAPDCLAPAAREGPRQLYRAGAYLSAHHLALSLRALCPAGPAASTWALISALALVELDDAPAAARLLREELDRDGGAAATPVALAWITWRADDAGAFPTALARLPPAASLRLQALAASGTREGFAARARLLPPELARPALEIGAELARARATHRPWLAGALSALLPGAGQVYAGSWQSAAVALVLNAVVIGATVELVRKDLPASAVAAATVGSIFYVGNIVNAADLARRQNQAAASGPFARLERLLVPEVHP